MIKTYTLNRETWVDIDRGTAEEIGKVMDTYKVHPMVAKELVSGTPKPRIELEDNYIYCILHFPTWKHTHSKDKNQEVDFIVGKNILITARYDTIDALDKFAKEVEVKEILAKPFVNTDGRPTQIESEFRDKNSQLNNQSPAILVGMLRELYKGISEELEYIEDRVEDITGKIFKRKEREMVVSISEMTRTLLDFKKVTDQHGEILETLKEKGRGLFGDEFANAMNSVISDYLKINTAIKSNLEELAELRQTDNSLLTAKQNETIKRLTIVGAILFILSILVTLYLFRLNF
ncbi:MAG: magnesium transporter CorA family protein [Candidatus Zambryskibacteria bacterium]|nr:magnesium transporter CorA family protein [Candidatus Zambryskibacteria bacterium]